MNFSMIYIPSPHPLSLLSCPQPSHNTVLSRDGSMIFQIQN